MKTYKIVIEELLSDTFEVVANSEEEAIDIAREKYNACEFVLEPGELLERKIYIE